MKILKTKFNELYVIKNKSHIDRRGFLKEIFNKHKINFDTVFQYFSVSKKNVFRGLHFQIPQQSKLITVVKGEIIDYCLDLRKKSKTFKKIFKIKLNDRNISSIIIPRGIAHGFYTLSDEAILIYNNNNYRSSKEYGINIRDKYLDIKIKPNTIISEKDKKNSSLVEFLNIHKSL